MKTKTRIAAYSAVSSLITWPDVNLPCSRSTVAMSPTSRLLSWRFLPLSTSPTSATLFITDSATRDPSGFSGSPVWSSSSCCWSSSCAAYVCNWSSCHLLNRSASFVSVIDKSTGRVFAVLYSSIVASKYVKFSLNQRKCVPGQYPRHFVTACNEIWPGSNLHQKAYIRRLYVGFSHSKRDVKVYRYRWDKANLQDYYAISYECSSNIPLFMHCRMLPRWVCLVSLLIVYIIFGMMSWMI